MLVCCLMARHDRAANILVYFVVQVVLGLVLMLFVVAGVPRFFLVLVVCAKLGLVPFHGWFIALVMSCDKRVLLYIMCLQKVPLVIVLLMVAGNNLNLVLAIGVANVVAGCYYLLVSA